MINEDARQVKQTCKPADDKEDVKSLEPQHDGYPYKFILRANRGVACSLVPRLPTRYVSSLAPRLLALHLAK
jgi:hypothetical protein